LVRSNIVKDRKPPPREERRVLDMDARLRTALASPPVRGALIVESDAVLCASLQLALAPLNPYTDWATGDIWPALIAAPAAVVVFGEQIACLRDFAAPRRLRRVAPSLPLVVLSDRALPRDATHLFDAIVDSPASALIACSKLTRR
jgi:hypothetical protein